ncbi:hypothetical protein KV205_25970 [Streptomyces sp. SKN60]|uniref:hypothetical protein n=1 Tax=Streptomyces sp. SKN60 TaxID=2855506 RepID=UPI0022468C27|nr:hypothetical protein [Streptomyces sp. SKN60]MCX2183952.1 hypothetical protein [Streptomyces sp. SKN60]
MTPPVPEDDTSAAPPVPAPPAASGPRVARVVVARPSAMDGPPATAAPEPTPQNGPLVRPIDLGAPPPPLTRIHVRPVPLPGTRRPTPAPSAPLPPVRVTPVRLPLPEARPKPADPTRPGRTSTVPAPTAPATPAEYATPAPTDPASPNNRTEEPQP